MHEILICHEWSSTWTVVFQCEIGDEMQKQMEMMMIEDQCHKNFANWAKIEEVWWIFGFVFLKKFWENEEFWDLILGSVLFCYDLEVIRNIYDTLIHD